MLISAKMQKFGKVGDVRYSSYGHWLYSKNKKDHFRVMGTDYCI